MIKESFVPEVIQEPKIKGILEQKQQFSTPPVLSMQYTLKPSSWLQIARIFLDVMQHGDPAEHSLSSLQGS